MGVEHLTDSITHTSYQDTVTSVEYALRFGKKNEESKGQEVKDMGFIKIKIKFNLALVFVVVFIDD